MSLVPHVMWFGRMILLPMLNSSWGCLPQIVFALVPPPSILGGWLCFFVSLAVIGLLTAIVGDLASIFGCLVGLKDAVTGEFFRALSSVFYYYWCLSTSCSAIFL